MSPPAGRPPAVGPAPTPPQAGLAALSEPLAEPATVGFVHVARGDDPARRYLTRTTTPQSPAAIVCLPSAGGLRAIYCVAESDRDTAVEEFVSADPIDMPATEIQRTVATRDPQTPPGAHVVSVLADHLDPPGGGTLRVPSHLPHDAAVRLQQAGYRLSSTMALTDARASKTPAEHECLQAVQRGAVHGLRRAHELLTASTITDGGLYLDGDPLSAQQVEREVAAALGGAGYIPETVQVRATATEPLPASDGIVVHLVPRGPHGYHGHLTRTVVVDSDGGWDRRAFIAAKAAQTAVRRHCEPGGTVETVAAEAVAELTAYGFPPRSRPDDAGDADATDDAGGWATVHGVGLAPAEAPRLDTGGSLRVGSVLAVETGVVDPEYGRIRLGSLIDVTADGGEWLIEAPMSLTPATDEV